jgi:hypothetical protein
MSLAKQKAFARKLKSAVCSHPASPKVSTCSSSGTQWPSTPMSPPRSQPTVTPMSPTPGSQPRSRRSRRVSQNEYPDCSQSEPYLHPPSPSSPPMPPPERFHFHGAQRSSTMPVMRSASFDSPHMQHFEELRTPHRMSWHYSPRHFGPGHHPPLSPQAGYMSPNRPEYMSPNRPEYMSRNPMSPGGHPMSPGLLPEYAYRPPMSPVMNRSWMPQSPQSFSFGQHSASPQSSPGPGWRSPISVHRRYGQGELAVPALSRESSMSVPMPMPSREESMTVPFPPIQTNSSPMCMSPMQKYHSCPSSPADFVPPSRKSPASALPNKSQGTDRDSPPTMSTNRLGKSLSPQRIVYHSSQYGSSDSRTSTAVVVCGGLDESRSDNMLHPAVEVILTDKRFGPEMTLDDTTEEEDFEDFENFNTVSNDNDSEAFSPLPGSEAFSPLPFDHMGGNEESYLEMGDDLFM